MSVGKWYPISSIPGIKRDGTVFAGNNYIDGQWCRFMRGVPRKIGGYRSLYSGLPNTIYGSYVLPNTPNFNIYIGDSSSLKYLPVDQVPNTIGPLIDRTPAGFIANPNYIWKFDLLFQRISNTNSIIAHPGANLSYIDNTFETPIYYGDVTLTTPLIPTGISVSGGIVVLGPYLVMYGNYGQIIISEANNPTVILITSRVSSQKIVHGAPVRAGNSSPGGLLWTLNSVIRMTFTPVQGEPDFSFDTIDGESSILSSRGVIGYDSFYYWAGIDRFLVYNGTVRELENNNNLLWFFRNLNYAQRQKVWATKRPEFGEIWWHFPFGNSTECNAAVIYNVRDNIWYDTMYDVDDPTIGRSSGYYEQVLADPISIDFQGNIWVEDVGTDKNLNTVLTPIKSYFETADISWAAVGPNTQWTGAQRLVDLYSVIPDFWQQSGDINLFVKGYQYPNSPPDISAPYVLEPLTVRKDAREQRNFMTLRFESNVLGGFYELGLTLFNARIGDYRP